MRTNAFLPQGHIRDTRLGQERKKSYPHREDSQEDSELQLEHSHKLLIIATPSKSDEPLQDAVPAARRRSQIEFNLSHNHSHPSTGDLSPKV